MQLFEALGQFPSEHDDAIGLECAGQIAHGLDDSMRRLVDHHDRIAAGERGKPLTASARARRQEALEAKPGLGKACDRQQRRHGRRARHRDHRQPGGMHGRYDPRAGVADAGCAGVAGQGDRLAGADALDNGLRHAGFVVLVTGDQRRVRADMIEQHARDTSVFGRRGVDPSQDIDGPQA